MKLSKFDAVGVNVKVYQMVEDEWSGGIIEEYHPRKGYHIQLFDGQDMWLENLDDVEFEEEYGTNNMEELGETFAASTFHEDELEILKDEDVLQEDHEMTVPDYQTHQEINHSSLRADLSALPSRGVLLCGSILGAAGLVLDNLDMDGEIFFKVLFVEGGSQPAMFRCKTPIYTSNSISTSLSNPIWDGARFQFDMIMPVDETADRNSSYGFKIQGEIMIAIYVSRKNGGNNLIGQASFQLKDIIETGTVEYFSAGYEGRSVTGGYTILSRSGGDITGEIDVQLNIAWKPLNTTTASGGMRTSQGRVSSTGLPPRPQSASSVTMHRIATATTTTAADSSSKRKATIDTATRSGSASRRPISATATANRLGNSSTAPAPRKIVSNIQRKQREDAARIAKENMKLQKTLQQHANRGRTSPVVPTNKTVYGAIPTTNTTGMKPTGGHSQYPDPKVNIERGRINEEKMSRNESKGNRESPSIDVLIKLYNDLKRQTALDEQENVRLRLKVGKLKVSIKQCEMSIDRIHSERNTTSGSNSYMDSQSKATASNSVRSSVRSSSNSMQDALQQQQYHRRSREGGILSYDADPKDGSQSARSQYKSTTAAAVAAASPSHSKPPLNTTTTPYFTPLTADEMKESNMIMDLEYKNFAEEYNVLQSVRKGLVERIKLAKYNSETAKEKHLSSYDRMEMIRRRLEYYRNIAGKYAIGIDLQLPSTNTTTGTGENKHTNNNSNASMYNDSLLFDQLRENKQEYTIENEIYTHNMHIITQKNSMEELNSIKTFLAKKCLIIEENINLYKNENQKFHQILREKLNNQHNNTENNDINYYIQKLRQKKIDEKIRKRKNSNRDYGNVLESGVEERLQLVDDNINAIESELKSIKERQFERRRSGSSNNNSNTNNNNTNSSSRLNDNTTTTTTNSNIKSNPTTEYLLDG